MSEICIRLGMKDLESLFVDSSGEVKIHVGQQIANEFAKRYLKSIIQDEVIRLCAADVRHHTKLAYAEYVNSPELLVKATPHIKIIVKERVRQQVEDLIKDEVAASTEKIRDKIDDIVLEEAVKLVKDTMLKYFGG